MIRLALVVVAAAAVGGLCGPAAGQDAPKGEPTAEPEQPPAASDAAAKAGAPEGPAAGAEANEQVLPRNVRWKRMDVHYLRANVRHPALYWDSVQEKVKHNDRPCRSLHGAAASCMYEIIQFPVQLGLTPVLMTIKPPWTVESSEP